MRMKLIPNDSAGTVTTFYVSQLGCYHSDVIVYRISSKCGFPKRGTAKVWYLQTINESYTICVRLCTAIFRRKLSRRVWLRVPWELIWVTLPHPYQHFLQRHWWQGAADLPLVRPNCWFSYLSLPMEPGHHHVSCHNTHTLEFQLSYSLCIYLSTCFVLIDHQIITGGF